MTTKVKKKLDYLPYVALLLSAAYLLYIWLSGDILLQLRHILGLVLLPAPGILFFYRHKLAVLFLGILLVIGLFGGISFSPAITTTTMGKSIGNGESITFAYFQPIFVLWLLLHFAISGRYYIGIASKKYWRSIASDEPIKIGAN